MRPLTRRQALAAAAAAGSAPLVGATQARAVPQVAGDAAVLAPVLRAEQAAQAAYRAAGADLPAGARAFEAHETEHVQALATATEALGAPKPPPPGDAAALDAATRRLDAGALGDARSSQGRLRVLLALEERLMGLWIAAHRDLSDPGLIQTATQVLACQAQHAVVLREALGRDPLPDALDAGR